MYSQQSVGLSDMSDIESACRTWFVRTLARYPKTLAVRTNSVPRGQP